MRALPSSTQGGSRVPESGTLGSVRGAVSNDGPYRDPDARTPANSLLTATKIPVPRNLFPVNLIGELAQKWRRQTGFWLKGPVSKPQNHSFPCKIRCFRPINRETGSHLTAHTTTQSPQTACFQHYAE